jgi:transposase
MNTSLLYHAFGLREQRYHSISDESSSIILNVQTRSDKLRCFHCKSKHIIRSGYTDRCFRCVPIGSKPVLLRMKVQRLYCKDCKTHRQEHLHFVTGKRSYTNKFARLVVELSRIGTLKDVSNFLT